MVSCERFKSCKLILHKTRQRCNSLIVRTGLQKFLTTFRKQTQTTITLVLSYVNYCLMGSSICSSPVSCFGNISFPTNSSTQSLASALIIGCMAKLARFFLCNIMCGRGWAVTRLWSPSRPLLIMNSNLFRYYFSRHEGAKMREKNQPLMQRCSSTLHQYPLLFS